jgi:hypothetical protein
MKKLIVGLLITLLYGPFFSAQAAWEGAQVTGTVYSADFPGQLDWLDANATISFTQIEFLRDFTNVTTSADFTQDTLTLTYENTSANPNVTYPPLSYIFDFQEELISSISLISSTFSQPIDISFTPTSITLDVALQNTNPGEIFTAVFALAHGTTSPEQSLLDTIDYVWSIPENAFKNNADNRKKALTNKLMAVIDTLEVAASEENPAFRNELYDEAIVKLENDIRSKTDSCFGGSDKNDWIVECSVQADLIAMIDDVIALIDALRS